MESQEDIINRQLKEAIAISLRYVKVELDDNGKRIFGKKEYKAAYDQYNALRLAVPTDLVRQASLFLFLLLSEIRRLVHHTNCTKTKLKGQARTRVLRQQSGFNNACRLTVLAKDALKLGVITFEMFSYIWNHLNHRGGLPNTIIDSISAKYFSVLVDTHPLYNSPENAEKRIQRLLVRLEFDKPYIP